MPYDKQNTSHRAAVAARIRHWIDPVPTRAVDQWIAVFNDVHKATRDEGRAIASANAVVQRRFPPAMLAPAITQGAKVLAATFGKAALRELELTLQNCECGQDHARTLAMVQMALRAANVAVGNPSGPARPARSATSDPFAGRVRKNVTVQVAPMWNIMAQHIYENADKLFVAVREMIQNSRDAKAKTIEITWTPEDPNDEDSAGTLVFSDDGKGMSLDTLENKFFSLGGSEKEAGSIGGFGAAKAAILTAGRDGWSWEIRTRNVWTKSDGFGSYLDPIIVPDNQAIRGTMITIYGVRGGFARTPMGSGRPIDRIRTLLACCDFRGLRVLVNNQAVTSYFANRRGRDEEQFESLAWGEFKPEIKSYARPDKRNGAIIVRVKGLAQFAVAAPYGTEFDRDYLMDFEFGRDINPNDPAYPFKAGRDSFNTGTDAWYAFQRFRDAVVVKAAQADKDMGEYEEIRPDTADPREQKAQAAFDDLMGDVMGSEGFQDVLGSIAELTDEMNDVIGEAVSAGQVEPATDLPEPGVEVRPQPQIGKASREVFDALLSPDLSEQVTRLEAWATTALAGTGGDMVPFRMALDRLRKGEGYPNDLEIVARVSKEVIARTLPETSALYVGALVSRILAVLEQGVPQAEQAEVRRLKKAGELNPFGGAGCIFVSRTRYGVEEGKKFRRGARKFMRHLAAWDFTVRAIMQAASTQSRWPQLTKLGVGFVLDREALGLTDSSGSFVMVNPHALARVADNYRDRPFIVAAWIHGVACHEIAHAMRIAEASSAAHNESWSIMREMLADSTLFLLPVIEDACSRLLKLRRRRRRVAAATPGEVDAQIADKLARTEQDLAEARITIRAYENGNNERRRAFAGVAHKLGQLIDFWEFREIIKNNPKMIEDRGIPAAEFFRTMQTPRAVEEFFAGLEPMAPAASLTRLGARWKHDAEEARVEATLGLGHAACRGCGGTCHMARAQATQPEITGGTLRVSGDLLAEWRALPMKHPPAFVDALQTARPGPRGVEMTLSADAVSWLQDPRGPVHGAAPMLREATRDRWADEAYITRAEHALSEVRKLASVLPERRHPACGCGGKRVVVFPAPSSVVPAEG